MKALKSPAAGVQAQPSPKVLVHEMAHQWYGDEVTPVDWRDVWMNEGLATFVQGTTAFEAIIGQAPGVLRNGAQAVKSGKIQMDALFSFDTIAPYGTQDCPRYGSLPGRNCR